MEKSLSRREAGFFWIPSTPAEKKDLSQPAVLTALLLDKWHKNLSFRWSEEVERKYPKRLRIVVDQPGLKLVGVIQSGELLEVLDAETSFRAGVCL